MDAPSANGHAESPATMAMPIPAQPESGCLADPRAACTPCRLRAFQLVRSEREVVDATEVLALVAAGGHRTQAARLLGITGKTIYNRAKRRGAMSGLERE